MKYSEIHANKSMAVTKQVCFYITVFIVLIFIGMLSLHNFKYDSYGGGKSNVNFPGLERSETIVELEYDVKSPDESDVLFPEGLHRISQRLVVADISLNDSEIKAELTYEQ